MIESELTSIKRKIRALSEKTVGNGCTEAEAMHSMRKVGELLAQYNLSMNEVTLRQEPCVTKVFSTGLKKRNVLWESFTGLKSFCGVKMWYTRSRAGMFWTFFGLESDVDMAMYLSDILSKAERTALSEFKKTDTYQDFNDHRLIATSNFKIAFGQRINARLRELAADARRAEERAHAYHKEQMRERMLEATAEASVAAAQQTTGTALICVAKEKMIEEEFKKKGTKLVNSRSYDHGRYNSASRDAGANAANRVNLNRPVNTKGNAGYLK